MKFGKSKNYTKIVRSGNKIIKKTPILLEWSSNQMMDWIYIYYNKLIKAGIPIPKILEYYESDTKNKKYLNMVIEYKGTPLIMEKHLDKYFTIIQKAVKNKVYLDPHIKNFSYLNNKVYYLDFTPPLIESYIMNRLKYESGVNKIMLENFLRNFSYENLIIHSIADLYKENKKKMDNSIKIEKKWNNNKIQVPLL